MCRIDGFNGVDSGEWVRHSGVIRESVLIESNANGSLLRARCSLCGLPLLRIIFALPGRALPYSSALRSCLCLD